MNYIISTKRHPRLCLIHNLINIKFEMSPKIQKPKGMNFAQVKVQLIFFPATFVKSIYHLISNFYEKTPLINSCVLVDTEFEYRKVGLSLSDVEGFTKTHFYQYFFSETEFLHNELLA